MSESLIIEKFRNQYSPFVGTLENVDDPTVLLLKLLAESEAIGNNYYNYYLSQEFDVNSYIVNKLFNYNLKSHIPYKYILRVIIKLVDANKSVKVELPKYTILTSDTSSFILNNSLIISNYNSTSTLELIQGTLGSESINQKLLITQSRYKLSVTGEIYPKIGYLSIDGIQYDTYSLQDAKYNPEGLYYGVELDQDNNYYLILSKQLKDKILNNSTVSLQYLINDIENDGETITSLFADPIESDGIEYEISISNLFLTSKARAELRSTTLVDFETNISKFDYESNSNALESVILSKAYDCSDVASGSIIELNPNNPETFDVKLGFYEDPGSKSVSAYSNESQQPIVPYYMYLVIASNDYSIQLRRDIMNSLSNGLCIKEVLLDYGTLSRDNYQVSVDNQGYVLNPSYRPYQLPYIIDANNSIHPLTEEELESGTKSSRYNMPDLVIQLEPASYVPVDISIAIDISYDSIDELMNFYLSLIDNIKGLFELSKDNKNLKFNSKLVKSEIENLAYQSNNINYVQVDDFVYYRNNISHTGEEIQFSPFELPVLGKLEIILDYHLVSEITPEVIQAIDDRINLIAAHRKHEFGILAKDNKRPIIKLELVDGAKVVDNPLRFRPLDAEFKLKIQYVAISVAADSLTITESLSAKSVIATTNPNHPTLDNKDYADDDANLETGLIADYPSYRYDILNY